MPKISPNLN